MPFTQIHNIASLTPTVCRAMGIEPPALSTRRPIHAVIRRMIAELDMARVDKCLIFCPDAIGVRFIRTHKALFKDVRLVAGQRVSLSSVFPPKTPVCFASMFTGAPPDKHGITKYTRPVLKCDTLFDALIRAGKKVAIVAVKNSSIDLIFRGRQIDYFSEEYDDEVEKCCLNLIKSTDYDLILAYQQEYDDILHVKTHECKEAVNAVERHVASFRRIAETWNRSYAGYNRMIIFAPDHGAHYDQVNGHSDHGQDIPEDMLISHFYGLFPGQS